MKELRKIRTWKNNEKVKENWKEVGENFEKK